MSLTKQAGFIGGAAAIALCGVCVADNTEGSVDEMRSRLLAAEAKIAELESQNNDNWLTEARTEQIRGLVHDVLADADTRASLLQSGMNVGYDNGAMIGSADGNWMLKTNLLMQQRVIHRWQDRESSPPGPADYTTDETRYGFENTRTKFILSGHVVNPDWTYMVDINVASNGNPREGVGNAWIGYNYGNGWSVKMGSMKAPLLREELVDAQHQLAVERSVANYGYTGGYVDGVAMGYTTDGWRATGAISDGARTGQTAFDDVDTEGSFTGRVEFLLSGTWDQFEDFTSPPGGEQGMMLGFAGHYQKGEYGENFDNGAYVAGLPFDEDARNEELEITILTADLSMEWGGADAFVAFMYADLDNDSSGDGKIDNSPWAIVVQGGFYLNDDWELFGRYEYGDSDQSGVDDLGIVTIGVNRYYAGHNAKWTTDISFATDEIDASYGAFGVPSALTAFDADDPGEDGQIVLRTQWQILF